MSNDLDLYTSDGLQPYSPSQPLQPYSQPNTPVDYVGHYPQQVSQNIPTGATQEQVREVQNQMAGMFASDMLRLGFDMNPVQVSIEFFKENMGNPRGEARRHNYNLFELENDPIAHAWANRLHQIGASQAFVQAAVWWCGELQRRLEAVSDSNATDGSFDPDDLSDAEYAELERINDRARAAAEVTLRRQWGQAYEGNVAAVRDYVRGLPQADRQRLDQYAGNGVHLLNDAYVVDQLFRQSIGAGSLPRGTALATEIAQIEQTIKVNRKAYNNDPRLQARLRTLYDLRDGS